MSLPKHSMLRLGQLSKDGPTPRSLINPGVTGLLVERGFAEVIELPSPFITHQKKQRKVQHLRITDAGRRFLGEIK